MRDTSDAVYHTFFKSCACSRRASNTVMVSVMFSLTGLVRRRTLGRLCGCVCGLEVYEKDDVSVRLSGVLRAGMGLWRMVVCVVLCWMIIAMPTWSIRL